MYSATPSDRDLPAEAERLAARLAELAPAAALLELGSASSGLAAAEAEARLHRFGPNRLPRVGGRRWYVELGKNFAHLFAVLLWCAAALAACLGMPELAWAIVLVIVINGLFSYWQQFRAERAEQALLALLPRRVTLRRDGREQSCDAEQVVPGDLLALSEGMAVPADARLVESQRLRVDASALTGESRPVSRTAAPATAAGRNAPEIPNLLLAGTHVVAGRGLAVVFATGGQTEFGRLAALTRAQPRRASPLTVEMRRVTRIITGLAVGMGLVFFTLGWGLGRLTPLEGFLFALGLIVANVPEGLLPTLSLALALGVRRMAARRALVKRLESVETLGAVSTIVTDKTGTLTCNQMTVRGLWAAGQSYDVTGEGYDPDGEIRPRDDRADASALPSGLSAATHLLRSAALCCDAQLLPPSSAEPAWRIHGDPTEAAILVAARKVGLGPDALAAWPRRGELPFDSVRQRMTTLQDSPAGVLACTKGALSEVLSRSAAWLGPHGPQPLEKNVRDEIELRARRFADRGWRVLAVAERLLPARLARLDEGAEEASPMADGIESELLFLGLVAMEDPPRAETGVAVAACRTAGIRVLMATGDDGHTAAAIAREIGLCGAEIRVVTGDELNRLSDRSLALLLGHREAIFARVGPAHKLRLVEALQARGEIVAVTGDGVNDAPALRRADVGVAMGASGADVAREAADVILLDDHFATIVAAIEEGRAVYANVRKFLTYILASNVPEIVPFIAFVLFRIPLPLTVMQILAVDLGTDVLPALALGAEPPEPDVMRRPPRGRSERLLDRATLLRAYAWLGAIEAGLCLGGFFAVYALAGWRPGEVLAASGPLYVAATTMSLAGIIACQVGNAFACRSPTESILRLGLASNRALLAALLAEGAVLAGLIYLPPLARLFQLAPLAPAHGLLLAGFGPSLLLAEELRKRRRRARRGS